MGVLGGGRDGVLMEVRLSGNDVGYRIGSRKYVKVELFEMLLAGKE